MSDLKGLFLGSVRSFQNVYIMVFCSYRAGQALPFTITFAVKHIIYDGHTIH